LKSRMINDSDGDSSTVAQREDLENWDSVVPRKIDEDDMRFGVDISTKWKSKQRRPNMRRSDSLGEGGKTAQKKAKKQSKIKRPSMSKSRGPPRKTVARKKRKRSSPPIMPPDYSSESEGELHSMPNLKSKPKKTAKATTKTGLKEIAKKKRDAMFESDSDDSAIRPKIQQNESESESGVSESNRKTRSLQEILKVARDAALGNISGRFSTTFKESSASDEESEKQEGNELRDKLKMRKPVYKALKTEEPELKKKRRKKKTVSSECDTGPEDVEEPKPTKPKYKAQRHDSKMNVENIGLNLMYRRQEKGMKLQPL
jgi:hypothetical protein